MDWFKRKDKKIKEKNKKAIPDGLWENVHLVVKFFLNQNLKKFISLSSL